MGKVGHEAKIEVPITVGLRNLGIATEWPKLESCRGNSALY